MKHATSEHKPTRQSERTAQQDTSASPKGISLAPPTYGIDFVDRGVMGAAPLQRSAASSKEATGLSGARQQNKTGLTAGLKAGVEHLSGLSMDDVQVHYNSPKPAQLQASAYTQGTDIHVGPGQERYLPHETWHVVQQKQGRVKPTMQMKGAAINDDTGLEHEADVMGQRANAVQRRAVPKASPSMTSTASVVQTKPQTPGAPVLQRSGAGTSLPPVQRKDDPEVAVAPVGEVPVAVAPQVEAEAAATPAPTVPPQANTTDPEAVPAAAPTAAPGAGQGPATAGAKEPPTTPLSFAANYTQVPGKGKNVVTARKPGDALWVSLGVKSHVPRQRGRQNLQGVVTGVGESDIGVAQVPVTEQPLSFGRGSVTANMSFTKELKRNLSVKVDVGGSTSKARKKAARGYAINWITDQMESGYGDIAALEKDAAKYLAEEHQFENPIVTITTKPKRAKELGMSTFYYQAWDNPVILMEVEAEPVGESTTNFSKTKDKDDSIGIKTGQKAEVYTETDDITRETLFIDTLQDIVKRVDIARSLLYSDLSDKIVTDNTYTKDGTYTGIKVGLDDYNVTRKLDKKIEEGDRKEKDWAAKGRDILGWGKDAIDWVDGVVGYFPDKIFGDSWVGRWGRKLRKAPLNLIGEGLGVAGKGLDLIAEEGTVHYTNHDEKETLTGGVTKTGVDTMKLDVDITNKKVEDRKRDLFEFFINRKDSTYTRFRENVQRKIDVYRRNKNIVSVGGSQEVATHSRRATSVTVSVETTWKFTKPRIKATVVGGRGSVSNTPFTNPEELS